MISAAFYYFYGFVALMLAAVLDRSERRRPNIIIAWFRNGYFWFFLSMLIYGTVVVLFAEYPTGLRYGMVLARFPLYIGCAWLFKIFLALRSEETIKIPAQFGFAAFVVWGVVFTILHATIWLGRNPQVIDGIAQWDVPLINSFMLLVMFLVTFVTTGWIFLKEAVTAREDKIQPALVGVGLLIAGVAGPLISALGESIVTIAISQTAAAFGAVLASAGLVLKERSHVAPAQKR